MKMRRMAAALSVSVSMLCVPFMQVDAAGYPFRSTCNYYYDQFDSAAQKLYDDLVSVATMIDESDAVYQASPMVYYSGINDDELRDLMTMFSFEHPEFFWISNRYGYGEDWMRKYVQLEIFPPFQDGAARQKAKEEILAAEQSYIDGAMAYETDHDRAEYLSRRLKSEISYGSADYNMDQSLASAFLYHRTVCAGYTKAYSLLANAVGVDTVALRSASHAWNATKIADSWYVDDVTNALFLYSDAQIRQYDERNGLIRTTSSDGRVTESLMHEKDYYYFTDIFPDTSKTYDGSSRVLSGMPEPVVTEPDPGTEPPPVEDVDDPFLTFDDGFDVTSKTVIFYADDTDLIDPADLVVSVRKPFRAFGSYALSFDVDPSRIELADGWETPADILEQQAKGKPFFHGALPAVVGEETLEIGDIWILRRGDITMDGIVNANDATAILISAASVGTGQEPKAPPGTEPVAALFAAKYVDDGAAYPNANDATAVLLHAARVGTGSE